MVTALLAVPTCWNICRVTVPAVESPVNTNDFPVCAPSTLTAVTTLLAAPTVVALLPTEVTSVSELSKDVTAPDESVNCDFVREPDSNDCPLNLVRIEMLLI